MFGSNLGHGMVLFGDKSSYSKTENTLPKIGRLFEFWDFSIDFIPAHIARCERKLVMFIEQRKYSQVFCLVMQLMMRILSYSRIESGGSR